jgi:galactose mutarotase-like enzyme
MVHEIRSSELTVKLREQGAEMFSVTNNDGLEFIWQADKDIWPRHAPVLFPIVGKLKGNSYEHNGRKYQMGQHGFARDKKFTLTGNSGSSCAFELRADDEMKKNYPFDFEFRISYSLDRNELLTRYEVHNPGSEPMYFSVGAHPGFRCPLAEGESFEDYFIDLGHDTFLQTVLKDGLRGESSVVLPMVGKKLFLSANLFDNDALVFENHQIREVSLCSAKSSHRITLQCHDWPYFGIWSKKGCKEFVCLEPWHGIADHVNASGQLGEKEGVHILDAGKTFSCEYVTGFN